MGWLDWAWKKVNNAPKAVSPSTPAPVQSPPLPATVPIAARVTAGTCNLRYEYDDDANTSWYGNFDWQADFIGIDQSRYLGKNKEYCDKLSDTNREYGERSLKPRSKGWCNWLGDQEDRCVKSGKGFIEYDNADYALERDRSVVMETYQRANSKGLRVILKNPDARDIREFGGLKLADGSSGVYGCIFESGTMGPVAFGWARNTANHDMQASWVRHGGSAHGQDIPQIANEVRQVKGTSIQHGPGEYTGMKFIEQNCLLG